jgi:hypothetical protein
MYSLRQAGIGIKPLPVSACVVLFESVPFPAAAFSAGNCASGAPDFAPLWDAARSKSSSRTVRECLAATAAELPIHSQATWIGYSADGSVSLDARRLWNYLGQGFSPACRMTLAAALQARFAGQPTPSLLARV